jgi:hypothetical protein
MSCEKKTACRYETSKTRKKSFLRSLEMHGAHQSVHASMQTMLNEEQQQQQKKKKKEKKRPRGIG